MPDAACIFAPIVAACLGAFDDFQNVCGERVNSENQYIIPELNFSCNGTVTQWKVGVDSRKRDDAELNLQIWRSVGVGEYYRVTEVVYVGTKGSEIGIATVPVSMSVQAGDMVGFYAPDRLRLHTLPDVGLTVYTTKRGSLPFLSTLFSTVGPSPYISVVFGEFMGNVTYAVKCHSL